MNSITSQKRLSAPQRNNGPSSGKDPSPPRPPDHRRHGYWSSGHLNDSGRGVRNAARRAEASSSHERL